MNPKQTAFRMSKKLEYVISFSLNWPTWLIEPGYRNFLTEFINKTDNIIEAFKKSNWTIVFNRLFLVRAVLQTVS